MLLPTLILLYCLWSSRELVQVWLQPSGYEHYSWILFIIWSLPLLYYCLYKGLPKQVQMIFLGLALVFSLAGNLGELHLFEYIGLALALAAFFPTKMLSIIWIIASPLWMPESSWIATHLMLSLVEYFFILRLFILIFVSLLLIINLNKYLK